jgi:hypothetical protein
MKVGSLLLLFFLVVVAFGFLKKESFTSPGTMVQLATSHVPTAEDAYYYNNVYPKEVRREITNMTGGDPGPIFSPYLAVA